MSHANQPTKQLDCNWSNSNVRLPIAIGRNIWMLYQFLVSVVTILFHLNATQTHNRISNRYFIHNRWGDHNTWNYTDIGCILKAQLSAWEMWMLCKKEGRLNIQVCQGAANQSHLYNLKVERRKDTAEEENLWNFAFESYFSQHFFYTENRSPFCQTFEILITSSNNWKMRQLNIFCLFRKMHTVQLKSHVTRLL